MNTPEKDYSHRGWIAALALIAVLGAVSFIPPQSLGGVKLRRANILSDILSFEDAAAEAAEPALFDEDDFHVDMAQVARRIEAERIEADTAPRPVQTIFEWLLRQDSSGRRAVVPDTVRLNPALVAIEQFAPADSGRLRAFYDTLLYARRPVRIAVLGDSFIEGDILTADLREKLQQDYGGGRKAGRHTTSCSAKRHPRTCAGTSSSRDGCASPRRAPPRGGKTPTTGSGSTPAPRHGCSSSAPATAASN